MKRFIQRFSDKIIGVLSGFDRLLIRGTIRAISLHSGMREFLYQNGVLLKDFGAYGQQVTSGIRQASHEIAEHKGRPFLYVPSSQTNKEEIALRVLKQQPVKKGLICMLSCVEPCKSFQVVRYEETKKIQLRGHLRYSVKYSFAVFCIPYLVFCTLLSTKFWLNSVMMAPALLQPERFGFRDFGGFGKSRNFTKGEFLRCSAFRYFSSS